MRPTVSGILQLRQFPLVVSGLAAIGNYHLNIQMLKPLIPSDDPLLHNKIKKCSYNLDRSKLSYTLNENMFHHEGVGLSSNQIGIEERVFVMMIDIDAQETITCFNPRIIKESKDEVVMEEGCLSYPELFLEISRPAIIVVKYEDEGKQIHRDS